MYGPWFLKDCLISQYVEPGYCGVLSRTCSCTVVICACVVGIVIVFECDEPYYSLCIKHKNNYDCIYIRIHVLQVIHIL